MIVLDERSLHLRRLILRGLIGGGRGHVGASFSLVEIFRVLYDDILRFDAKNPEWQLRDRCILSKGHGCLALYAVLVDKGFFPKNELDTFCRQHSILGGHPEIKTPGVEFSTGALGHGLSISVGMALAAKMQQRNTRLFVICGDGEINEGSIWEAAMSAAKHRLSNLTVLIDYNKIQSYGTTKEVLDLEPLVDKWRSFGFATQEVGGHDVAALKAVLSKLPQNIHKPNAIICHTIKGKGFEEAEHNPLWHHKSKFTEEEVRKISEALGEV